MFLLHLLSLSLLDSPADMQGLCQGDVVVSVNSVNVLEATHSEIIELMIQGEIYCCIYLIFHFAHTGVIFCEFLFSFYKKNFLIVSPIFFR